MLQRQFQFQSVYLTFIYVAHGYLLASFDNKFHIIKSLLHKGMT